MDESCSVAARSTHSLHRLSVGNVALIIGGWRPIRETGVMPQNFLDWDVYCVWGAYVGPIRFLFEIDLGVALFGARGQVVGLPGRGTACPFLEGSVLCALE